METVEVISGGQDCDVTINVDPGCNEYNITVDAYNGSLNVIKFQIGDGNEYTPASGTKIYNNPTIKDVSSGVIIRNGLPMLSGYSIVPSGGFQLTAEGDVFSNGEEFVWMY